MNNIFNIKRSDIVQITNDNEGNMELWRQNMKEQRVFVNKTLFFGDVYKRIPKSWEICPNRPYIGILSNAHDIWHRIGRKIHEFEMYGGAPYIIDSGGYQPTHYPGFTLDEVIMLYNYIGPDVVVAWDKAKNMGNMAQNFKQEMKEYGLSMKYMLRKIIPNRSGLMPVLHGYTPDEIDLCVQTIMDSGFYTLNNNNTISMIGLGSMVPLMMPKYAKVLKEYYPGQTGHEMFTNIIKYVRSLFPNTYLHIFGVGGINTIKRAILAGASSVDSRAWWIKAYLGGIHLFDGRIIYAKSYQNKMKRDDMIQLSNCKCPVCNEQSLRVITERLFRDNPVQTKLNRAIHNMWTCGAMMDYYHQNHYTFQGFEQSMKKITAIDELKIKTYVNNPGFQTLLSF